MVSKNGYSDTTEEVYKTFFIKIVVCGGVFLVAGFISGILPALLLSAVAFIVVGWLLR